MAETSFPMADGGGVTDAAYERLMGPVTGSGRYAFSATQTDVTTPLIFADSSGRQVKAYANQAAIVRGFRWESGTTPVVIPLDANTSGNPRLDLIVLRLSRSNYQVRLTKINGTPAASPNAPAPIQDTGTTGVWDLPVARVRVASSGTTGQPTIAPGDVTPVDWWVTTPALVARAGLNPVTSPGQLVHQHDTSRLYRSVGNSLTLLGERGDFTKLTASAGWSAGDNIYARRVNGFVYFQAQVVSALTNKASGTDMSICTLPSTFRTDGHDVAGVCWMSPNQIGQVYFDVSGTVIVRNYPETFPTGGTISVHPMTWPASN